MIVLKIKIKNKIKNFARNFKNAIKRPEMSILPGQLAFFFVLAIVPTITIISYGASLLNLSTDVIYEFLTKAFSKDLAIMLLYPERTGLSGSSLILIIVIGYYMASNGPASIILTSNAIYGEKQESWIRRRLKAFVMTFFLILLFIFILIVPVFGETITDILIEINVKSNILNYIIKIYNLLKGPLTWLIIFIFIKILYKIAPNKEIESKNVNIGAVFTSIGWILVTNIYSYYINNFAHYTTYYGGLANIVILMLWFYLLAFIFTVGMALNYRKEEERELEKTGMININNK